MNSRAPPLAPPSPWPGCCTLCVASKITGASHAVAHAREAAHVDDEIAVAEEGAALGDGDRRVARAVELARRRDLVDRAAHAFGMHPLALLHVHRLARCAGGDEQIGLPAEEGGDLQHVDDLRRRRALLGQMHVGEDRQARSPRARVERGESPSSPGPRCAPAFERLALSKLAL